MAKVDYGTQPPTPKILQDGRLQAVRVGRVLEFTAKTEERFKADSLPQAGAVLPGYPLLKLVGLDYNAGGGGDSSLTIREVYEELSPHNNYQDMAITFPGVRPSAFTIRDDFAFRTAQESRVVTVRIATRFFTVEDPRRIQLIPRFDPRSVLTGDAVSVLDDNSTTTSDEYLAWVASGQEFVDRCIRRQIFKQIWARDTYYVRAE